MSLSVRGLTKRFDDVVALDDVDLDARDGELLVVVGPSGSGKTTLLRSIAGLETPDRGRIEVSGRDVTEVAPGDRDVAMVFQEYALFPHLDASANIAFGLKARRVPRARAKELVDEAAERLELGSLLDRKPAQLSGGERQRVALARAVVRDPSLYLMDEPLASLDAELRTRTRAYLRRLQASLGRTMLYVTHDQVEAMTLGDRVVILRDGRVEQIGTPREIHDEPASAFVGGFIGHPPMNLLPGEVLGMAGPGSYVGIRPERIYLVEPTAGSARGVVELVEWLGSESLVHVRVDTHTVIVKCVPGTAPVEGRDVGLEIEPVALTYFDGPDGRALR